MLVIAEPDSRLTNNGRPEPLDNVVVIDQIVAYRADDVTKITLYECQGTSACVYDQSVANGMPCITCAGTHARPSGGELL